MNCQVRQVPEGMKSMCPSQHTRTYDCARIIEYMPRDLFMTKRTKDYQTILLENIMIGNLEEKRKNLRGSNWDFLKTWQYRRGEWKAQSFEWFMCMNWLQLIHRASMKDLTGPGSKTWVLFSQRGGPAFIKAVLAFLACWKLTMIWAIQSDQKWRC